jgi:hypothetical protein
VFGVDELKVQARADAAILTLIDLDPKDCAGQRRRLAEALRIQGTAAATSRATKCFAPQRSSRTSAPARKGRRQDAIPKARRVLAAGNP